MNNIPLVRVRYADSFAKVLNSIGAPTERILNTVGLSEEILTVPDGFMPVEQLWRFTALASNYTGVTDIGLNSGLMPLGQHSQFGHKVMASTNLHQAIMKWLHDPALNTEEDDLWVFGLRMRFSL